MLDAPNHMLQKLRYARILTCMALHSGYPEEPQHSNGHTGSTNRSDPVILLLYVSLFLSPNLALLTPWIHVGVCPLQHLSKDADRIVLYIIVIPLLRSLIRLGTMCVD